MAVTQKRSVSVSEGFFFSAVSFPLRRLGRLCGAFPFARRSSRGLLDDAVTDFILTHTAVECVCGHIHSTHAEGNVLDVYSIDPFTGAGTESDGGEVNLPQTGYSVVYNYIMLAAAAMVLFGIYAMAKSRKREEE